MDKIVDNEFVTVWVYPDKKIVHHKFHKFIYGGPFRDAMMKGADAFEKHHCVKWLSDDRNNSALLPEDSEWGGNLGAAHYESWLEVLGFNLARKVVGQMNMNRLMNRYSASGVHVQVFSDPTAALNWLEKQ